MEITEGGLMNTKRGISTCKTGVTAGLLVLGALVFGSSHAKAQQLLGPVTAQGNIHGYTGIYSPGETLTVSVPHCITCSPPPFVPLPVSNVLDRKSVV